MLDRNTTPNEAMEALGKLDDELFSRLLTVVTMEAVRRALLEQPTEEEAQMDTTMRMAVHYGLTGEA
jgi:hypothetical protein